MNTTRENLIGRWTFIGAQRFTETDWIDSQDFIDTMTWEFHPQYFGSHKVLGQIIESSGNGDSEQFPYSYDLDSHLLTIEVTSNNQPYSRHPTPLLDKYEVIECEVESGAAPIIKISILNDRECPPPYFLYILRGDLG